jgi:hypothetical protein
MTKVSDERVATLTGSGELTEIRFMGEPGDRLLIMTHRPATVLRGAVVVASPVYSESLKNNRREVLLARRLASSGIGVCRFQYRGTGSSDDAPLARQTMAEDLCAVIDHARDSFGVGRVGVVATRLSALVLADILDDTGVGPIALIEPVLSGRRFFKELLRIILMRDLARGHGGAGTAELVDSWRRQGWIDVLGFSLDWQFHESFAPAQFPERLGSPRPVAVVQMSRTRELRTDLARAVEAWRAADHTVDTFVVPREEAWWFHEDVDVLTVEAAAVMNGAVVDWLVGWFDEVVGR